MKDVLAGFSTGLFSIPEGMGPQLEGRFAGRAKMVEGFDGFEDFQRLGSLLGGGTAYTLVGAEAAHGPLAVSVGDGAGSGVSALLQPRLWVVRMR